MVRELDGAPARYANPDHDGRKHGTRRVGDSVSAQPGSGHLPAGYHQLGRPPELMISGWKMSTAWLCRNGIAHSASSMFSPVMIGIRVARRSAIQLSDHSGANGSSKNRG